MVLFDPHRYAYPSRRSVVYARRAMACTSVPLGAQVGLDVMKAGGNAVDAAGAMAALHGAQDGQKFMALLLLAGGLTLLPGTASAARGKKKSASGTTETPKPLSAST